MEGVATFRYMGRTLDQTDNHWPAVRRNIVRARSVCVRLGTLLRREGAYPRVAEIFYRAVVQDILLYGSNTWVLSVEMEKDVEGAYMGFFRQITGKQLWRILDRTWEMPRGGSSAGSGGKSVKYDLYRETAGNCGTVGGVTTGIQIVCRGEGL